MRSDWLTRRWLAKYYSSPSSGTQKILNFPTICRYIVKYKVIFKFDSYSACVVYTKTIIHLSESE